jgi:hypothetical protein
MWLPWAMLRFSSVLKTMIFSGYSTATTTQTSHTIILFNLYSFPSSPTLIRCTSHTHLCVCEFHLFRTHSYFPHTNTTFKNHLQRRANQSWQILNKNVSQQVPFQQKNTVSIQKAAQLKTETRHMTSLTALHILIQYK